MIYNHPRNPNGFQPIMRGNPNNPEALAAKATREKLEQQAKKVYDQISNLIHDTRYLETEREHERMAQDIHKLQFELKALGEEITDAREQEKESARIVHFKPTHCRFCGSYRVIVAGNVIAETPLDNCCRQQAEQVIENARAYIAGEIKKLKVAENDFLRDNEKKVRAEQEREFGKPNFDKIDRLRNQTFPTNPFVLELIAEEQAVIHDLKNQLTRGLPDVNEIKFQEVTL